MIDVIPGILESQWSEIEAKVKGVARFVEWVQIDVADGTLVPDQTVVSFDQFIPLSALVRPLNFEAHLMVASPEKYIRPLVSAGFKRIIAHLEANDPRLFFDQVQYESVEVGIAIDGPTELEQIEPFLDSIDVALVMTTEAGVKGQPFLPETVEKIKAIHSGYPDLPIEVEGGINHQTGRIVKDAGATRLVSTSYIFKDLDKVSRAIEALKQV